MNRHGSRIANVAKPLEHCGEFNPSRFVDRDHVKGHRPVAPRVERHGPVGIEPLVLHVDVRDPGGKLVNGLRSVRLTALFEISRLKYQTEIGMVDAP